MLLSNFHQQTHEFPGDRFAFNQVIQQGMEQLIFISCDTVMKHT